MSQPTTSKQLRSELSGHLAGEFELAEIVVSPSDGDRGIELDFWARDETETDPDLADYACVKLTLADAKALQSQLEAMIRAAEARRL